MPPFLADVLTWPGNRSFITAIRAAERFGVPPTVLLLNDRQPDKWTQIDKKLAIAYQILEDETCKDCGVPIWIGHSDDEHVVFEIKSRICYACAEVEGAQADAERRAAKRKGRGETKGKKRFLATTEDSDMPSREAYFQKESGMITDD